MKASIKTAHVNYNASMGSRLRSLNVTRVTTDAHENTAEMPLWSVESAKMNILNLAPSVD